jgi:hypothetical protein
MGSCPDHCHIHEDRNNPQKLQKSEKLTDDESPCAGNVVRMRGYLSCGAAFPDMMFVAVELNRRAGQMRRLFLPFVVLLLVLNVNSAFAQYGLNFSAIGPVNRGMGGVATATPIHALGALHWNPATIAALPSSEMAFGIDGVLPVVDIDSSLGADALARWCPGNEFVH